MLKFLLAYDKNPVMGKRDVKRAFKFNTIDPEQGREFAWVVWMAEDG